jgi:hypothetical protein
MLHFEELLQKIVSGQLFCGQIFIIKYWIKYNPKTVDKYITDNEAQNAWI